MAEKEQTLEKLFTQLEDVIREMEQGEVLSLIHIYMKQEYQKMHRQRQKNGYSSFPLMRCRTT